WGEANPAAVSAGAFPTFEPVMVNLGTGFAGKTLRVRFRSGSDSNGVAAGFLLDDLSVTGITTTPCVTLAPDALQCRPTADAGAAMTVTERTAGTLPGSYRQTPGTTPPALLWTQTSGPFIALMPSAAVAQPTFVAPEVAADSTATFPFTATGIQGSSSA